MKPSFESLDDFVKYTGGARSLKRVLVANNGIGAVKCIRSIRQWAYETFGDDRIVKFVVMATPEDLEAGAEYIKIADAYEEVPGGRNDKNYANVDIIREIACRTKCDAVWAGWGHASEFPSLPATLREAGIVFLGPGAKAMRDLGDKIASTILAQSAQVPTIPWSGDGVTVDYANEGIPDAKLQSACVTTVEEAQECVSRIGLPVMIKASEGGGGKGIRKVQKESELVDAFRRVQQEVPGSPIFVMKMGSNCRHLEVQLLADEHGEAIAIYGRDCSTQRRHQKIIEEGPVAVASASQCESMEKAAVRLAKAVGYCGVGTVEYLYSDNAFYFLELNPRLQVEHPVSELISGVNLPAAQLMVGMGLPLGRIPSIRTLFGGQPWGQAPVDVSIASNRIASNGHVIAVRITAENAREGFQPTSGKISELTFRSLPNVWGYFSVGSGGGVHEFADSQIGHLFAWGASREHCRSAAVLGLKELVVRGDIHTPVEYLISLLETPAFTNNDINTDWLDTIIRDGGEFPGARSCADAQASSTVVVCAAAFQAFTRFARYHRDFTSQISLGRIPPRALLNLEEHISFVYSGYKYACRVTSSGRSSVYFALEGHPERSVTVEMRAFSDDGMLMLFNGASYFVYMTASPPSGWKLTIDGQLHLVETESDPSKLLAPSSGKLVQYLVPAGSHVDADTAYAEMEIMKMILPLVCPVAGHISYQEQEGAVLSSGDLIATIAMDDASSVVQVPAFEDSFDAMESPRPESLQVRERLLDAERKLDAVLRGYAHPDVQGLVDTYILLQLEEHGEEAQFERCLPFFERFLREEQLFHERPREIVMLELREQYANDLRALYEVTLAHHASARVSRAVALLMQRLLQEEPSLSPAFASVLRELYILQGPAHLSLSLQAGRLLAVVERSPPSELWQSLTKRLKSVQEAPPSDQMRMMQDLSRSDQHGLDVLRCAVSMGEKGPMAQLALEVFVRSMHAAYPIAECQVSTEPMLQMQWVYHKRKEEQQQQQQKKPARVRSESPTARWLSQSDAFRLSPEVRTPGAADLRRGIAVSFSSLETFRASLPALFEVVHARSDLKEKVMLKVIIINSELDVDESVVSPPLSGRRRATLTQRVSPLEQELQGIMSSNAAALTDAGVSRVTIMVSRFGRSPTIYTFRDRMQFLEDPLYRNIAPPRAYHLELHRLSRYNLTSITTSNANIVLFYGSEPTTKDARLFGRAVVQTTTAPHGSESSFGALPVDWSSLKVSGKETFQVLIRDIEVRLIEAMNALEMSSVQYPTVNNHLFFKIVSAHPLASTIIEIGVTLFMKKFGARLHQLNVSDLELVFSRLLESGHEENTRVVIKNPSGYLWRLETAKETKSVVDESPPAPNIYEPNTTAAFKRQRCRRLNTAYVYDYIDILERALNNAWQKAGASGRPTRMLQAQEMVLSSDGGLVDVQRPAGLNTVGMVAWRVVAKTPEYPEGRRFILVANDITFVGGSFAPKEDEVYARASRLARQLGVPRIYISANAGARIGLAKEVFAALRVHWKVEGDPAAGLHYLYLDKEKDAAVLPYVQGEDVEGHPERLRITSVIGKEHGLGVENLQAAGMIAGETSVAYRDTFTLTLVSGFTVGIGSYVTRLGQRVIQNQAPILLTGFDALNRLLGNDVYISNTQLGGPHIMYNNGVTHVATHNDLESLACAVRWLSYVPATIGSPLPRAFRVDDPVDRPLHWSPQPGVAYDPRILLNTFFDKDSFFETMGGWANTVVTGRARLGGIPVGVVAVETRTVQKVIPADPASDASREEVIQQAGQVWYPDSAYKTATAINDFNQGEELPLIIFANWRGFSGGVADMYREILKFGSMIVDALSVYKKPVFVYIPPEGELRGGAWAVVDPTINAAGRIEMFSSERSRGGILEATGTVEIKFRAREQHALMDRLDAPVVKLVADIKAARIRTQASDCGAAEKVSLGLTITKLEKELSERREHLARVYHQIGLQFADCHDTPQRMKAKGVISDVVPWAGSRTYFYHRLNRRVLELEKAAHYKAPLDVLMAPFTGDLASDQQVAAYLQEQTQQLEEAAAAYAAKQSASELAELLVHHDADSLKRALALLSEQDRAKFAL